MRHAVALLIATLALAGCGQSGGSGSNSARSDGLPPPRPEAGSTASLTQQPGFRERYREINIASCVASAEARSARGDGAPPGSDFRGYCTCTVDGAMEGLPTEQLATLRPGPREEAIATRCAGNVGLRTNFGGSSNR